MTSRSDNDAHKIWIAVGQGGLSQIKCKEVLWKRLKKRCSEPAVDTSTTLAQYLALVKKSKSDDKQAAKIATDKLLELKRAPGNWTAAKYKGTSRKAPDVLGKSCVVLDLDYVTHDQLDFIIDGLAEVNAFEWFMHTSRSHIPEKPRVRLIIPCSRLMSPEESEAIHRLVALYLAEDPEEAIEIPDLVSYRVNQTMFWPSISHGQEFWTKENHGAILDVDDFLEQHDDWTNYETLPFQEAETKRGQYDPSRKMEDPREKANPIGAFCRAFTVEDVIERWLPDIYSPGDSSTETRYDYVPGSASNGAVVYDGGLFLHSNHGTDPIEGSANAWDLCRIHKFGHLDDDAHANTSPMNLPSSKAMIAFARTLEEVVSEEFASHDDLLDDLDDDEEDTPERIKPKDTPERIDEDDQEVADLLGEALDDLPEGEESTKSKDKAKKADSSWMVNLRRKANGDLENVQTNISLICAHDPRICDSIGYNEFTLEPVCLKPIRSKAIKTASRPVLRKDRKHGRLWADSDDMAINEITSAISTRKGYETDFPRNQIEAAVLNAGMNNPIHPVKDFLMECHARWKREKPNRSMLDNMPQDFLGCPDTPFHRESSRMHGIQCVARIMEPGCKVDTMAIIQGPTGSRKSTYWDVYFSGFFTELKADLEKVDRVIENIRGHWGVEMGEMRAAKRADSNTLKMMLSSVADVHRLAYARREAKFPRQSVFVGSSNEKDFLSDPTSSRRYWVWETLKTEEDPIDIDRLRDALWIFWGEAVQAFLDMREAQPEGPLWLDLKDPESIKERDRIATGNRKRTATEEVADVIEEWLNTPQPACDVFVGKDGMTLPGYENDETPMLRNMVTAKEAFVALKHEEVLTPYRNMTANHYGTALARVPGWQSIGKLRRHGKPQQVWFCRGEDGPLWVPQEDALDDEIDDLLA